MTRRRLSALAVSSLAIAAVAASLTLGSTAPAGARDAPLSVVTTTGMLADAAERIGGELVEVRALMGPGVDPHGYRQTRTDIVALTRADLVLWHGLGLEAQMTDLFGDLSGRLPVVAVGEAIPTDLLLAGEYEAALPDPHVWMVPTIWTHAVEAVRDALIEVAPESEDELRERADLHLEEIAALADYAERALGSVPAERRLLLTAHDAFRYFGEAYAYEVVGVQGVSTESEAGLARIGELVDLVVEREIPAVFVETSVADRNVRALIEGAAARGWRVSVGGELFSDAMGEAGTYEGSYIGMIDHNVTTITRALGGEAPERGLNGQLGASM
ncbi:MAG: zinc ABC transporter substrate-binding protein [Microvirga sp.]|nr:zinc ABC transporter substrate-binding protein [Microvirga sp.]